jgi:hypothetical protein
VTRRVFSSDRTERAAQAIVAYATCLANPGQDVDDELLMSLGADVDANAMLAAAGVLIVKLIEDRRTIYRIPTDRTLARLGMWVATNEVPS